MNKRQRKKRNKKIIGEMKVPMISVLRTTRCRFGASLNEMKDIIIKNLSPIVNEYGFVISDIRLQNHTFEFDLVPKSKVVTMDISIEKEESNYVWK